jgi:hypothetical protein
MPRYCLNIVYDHFPQLSNSHTLVIVPHNDICLELLTAPLKVNMPLCLTKHYAIKRMGTRMYRSMFSWPRRWASQLDRSMLCLQSFKAFPVFLTRCVGRKNGFLRRMVSSGMLRRVALVGNDVSEELSASFIRVTRIGELGTALAVTSNRRTQRASVTSYS